jgi:hypothetical protein
MFVNRNFFDPTVPNLIIYKKTQNTMKLNIRHGEFEQGCVLSESYTATDALPPILPACRQRLLPACVFVTRDTVRHPRRLFFSENLFVMIGLREPRLHCIRELYIGLYSMYWKLASSSCRRSILPKLSELDVCTPSVFDHRR